MDRETDRELDRLLHDFQEALNSVKSATGDSQVLAAWHRVQVAGWELNALLPTAEQHTTV